MIEIHANILIILQPHHSYPNQPCRSQLQPTELKFHFERTSQAIYVQFQNYPHQYHFQSAEQFNLCSELSQLSTQEILSKFPQSFSLVCAQG